MSNGKIAQQPEHSMTCKNAFRQLGSEKLNFIIFLLEKVSEALQIYTILCKIIMGCGGKHHTTVSRMSSRSPAFT
jgi:hypothetical protein